MPSSPSPSRRRRSGSDVQSITGAPRAWSDELRDRQRRYLFSMSVRTICFVAAVFVGGWLRWVLLAAAILLPYFSVVIANAGREQIAAPPKTLIGFGRGLPPAPPPSEPRSSADAPHRSREDAAGGRGPAGPVYDGAGDARGYHEQPPPSGSAGSWSEPGARESP